MKSQHVLPADPEELLDQNHVAKLLRVSPKFLERHRFFGDGPPYIKVGRLARYRRADVMSWIESRRMHSTSQPA